MRQKPEPVADDCASQYWSSGVIKRPVNKHGAADHVLLWNETPVAAVIAHVPVVAHGKVTVRRHHDVAALDMRGSSSLHFSLLTPYSSRRRHGGKIVAVGIVVSRIDVLDVRLVELLPVAVDDAFAQVNTVARNADDAFHQKKPRLLRRQEHRNISATDVAIGHQRPSQCVAERTARGSRTRGRR